MKMKKKVVRASAVVYACLIYIFIYLPILVLVAFSFNTSKLNIKFEGFTLDWYVKLFHNQDLMLALQNTLIIAVASTVLSTLIGTIAAVGLYRYSFKGKNLIDSILYIPVVIPEIVLGISLLSFFTLVKIPIGLISLIIAHATFSIPFVVITVKSRMSGYDMSVEEAAMDLGANRLKTFIKITLPLIMPGVFAGAMLAFTLSLDDVIVSFFTAGPTSTTLPLKIFSMVKFGVTPEINALSTLMILAIFLLVVITQSIESRKGLNS